MGGGTKKRCGSVGNKDIEERCFSTLLSKAGTEHCTPQTRVVARGRDLAARGREGNLVAVLNHGGVATESPEGGKPAD